MSAPKPKSKPKTTAKSRRAKQAANKPVPIAQQALRVTWVLKGKLKSIQLNYLRIAELLIQVRDEKLYEALKHPDLEHYAEERLHLGRASLYRYLCVHDWVARFHKEWLEPKPKGFIPELSDTVDLMWIDNELTRKDLEPTRRTALEDLRQKGLEGNLRKAEVDKFRRRKGPGEEGLKSFLSKLRLLRMRGSQLANMPPEVISHLDTAIDVLKNAQTVQLARLDFIRPGKGTGTAWKFSGAKRLSAVS